MESRLISRRLLGALVVSALLHWLLVSGNADWLPALLVHADSIEVSFAHPVVPVPVQPALPPVPVRPHPKPPALAKAKPQPAKPVEPVTPAPVVTTSAIEPRVTAPSLAEPSIATAEQTPADIPPLVAEEEAIAIPPPPKKVEIEFSGNNGSRISGKQTFESSEDGRYKLSAEFSMPVLLFVSGTMEQLSEGLITPTGLQPYSFRQKITSRDAEIATFDWVKKKVKLYSGKHVDVADLPENAQDRLSFMYQFMFVPPLQEMRLSLTDGKKIKSYLYEFEGEDSISTKIGTLRTWHIAKTSNDNESKTELWLAIDYLNLPVRIRQREKDGTVTDLIVSNLKMNP